MKNYIFDHNSSYPFFVGSVNLRYTYVKHIFNSIYKIIINVHVPNIMFFGFQVININQMYL